MDVIFVVDATGSMGSTIEAAKERCLDIAISIRDESPTVNLNYAAVFYRDPVDSPSDTNDYFPLNHNVEKLQQWIATQPPTGGGDSPEDFVGAYHILLNHLNLRTDSVKLLIHFADAGAHGEEFGYSGHEDQVPLLINLIKELVEKKIEFRGLSIAGGANSTFDRIKHYYDQFNNNTNEPSFSYEVIDGDNGSEGECDDLEEYSFREEFLEEDSYVEYERVKFSFDSEICESKSTKKKSSKSFTDDFHKFTHFSIQSTIEKSFKGDDCL